MIEINNEEIVEVLEENSAFVLVSFKEYRLFLGKIKPMNNIISHNDYENEKVNILIQDGILPELIDESKIIASRVLGETAEGDIHLIRNDYLYLIKENMKEV